MTPDQRLLADIGRALYGCQWVEPMADDLEITSRNVGTGGPALRIIGTLTSFGTPETAALQWQDWGTPWADAIPTLDLGEPFAASDIDAILISYASHFYFGG